jgi:oxygen-independent coproporphyrinogen-3 oxidase
VIDAPAPLWGERREGKATIPSLYVHAPFCHRRCFYCDFAVTVSRAPEVMAWLETLASELNLLEEEGRFQLAPALETLFVGGGTPSVLGPSAMRGLAGILGKERLRGPELEWAVEANPESFTLEVAREWKAAGVNRISFGAQSFQAGPLAWMGRLHGPKGPSLAVSRAREVGISNLSLDLIFGLPDEVPRDWEADLEEALSLEVPHLSLYGLTAESGTPLGRAVGEDKVRMAGEGRYGEEYLLAAEKLTAAGYHHYEISSFALPGFESRHNRVYWDMLPYLGVGNSAHSFSPPVRRWNMRNWGDYQEAVFAGELPVAGEEELAPQQLRMEKLWLGLRTNSGLEEANLSPRGREMVRGWVAGGKAELRGGRVRLTPDGWLVLDHLTVELDGAEDDGR